VTSLLIEGHLRVASGALVAPAHSPYLAGNQQTERFPTAMGKAVFAALHLHI
jgi:hypothetical protein